MITSPFICSLYQIQAIILSLHTVVTRYRPAVALLSRCYRQRDRVAAAATRDKTRLGSQIGGMQGACALRSVYCRIFAVEGKKRGGQALNEKKEEKKNC